jgi:hypothetical protein
MAARLVVDRHQAAADRGIELRGALLERVAQDRF